MSPVHSISKNYFNAISDVSHFDTAKNKILTVLAIISCITVVIPLGFAVAYSLSGRNSHPPAGAVKVNTTAAKHLVPPKQALSPMPSVSNQPTLISAGPKKPLLTAEEVQDIKNIQSIKDKASSLGIKRFILLSQGFASADKNVGEEAKSVLKNDLHLPYTEDFPGGDVKDACAILCIGIGSRVDHLGVEERINLIKNLTEKTGRQPVVLALCQSEFDKQNEIAQQYPGTQVISIQPSIPDTVTGVRKYFNFQQEFKKRLPDSLN